MGGENLDKSRPKACTEEEEEEAETGLILLHTCILLPFLYMITNKSDSNTRTDSPNVVVLYEFVQAYMYRAAKYLKYPHPYLFENVST